MRKRVRKKVEKYKCLKCGSEDGQKAWYKLKTGRYVSTKLSCIYCDCGMDRKWEQEFIRKRLEEKDERRT